MWKPGRLSGAFRSSAAVVGISLVIAALTALSPGVAHAGYTENNDPDQIAAEFAFKNERIVRLSGSLTHEKAVDISNQLLYLDANNPGNQPINLHINSSGGLVSALMQIFETMQQIKTPVHTVCESSAFSAAAWLLTFGEPGHRHAYEGCRLMIHDMSWEKKGTLIEHKDKVEGAHILFDEVLGALSERTGWSAEQLKSMMSGRDLYLTVEEAIAWGFIDDVIQRNPNPSPATQRPEGFPPALCERLDYASEFCANTPRVDS